MRAEWYRQFREREERKYLDGKRRMEQFAKEQWDLDL